MNGEITDEASKISLENKYVTERQASTHSFEEIESLTHVKCSEETMRASLN